MALSCVRSGSPHRTSFGCAVGTAFGPPCIASFVSGAATASSLSTLAATAADDAARNPRRDQCSSPPIFFLRLPFSALHPSSTPTAPAPHGPAPRRSDAGRVLG